MGVRRRIWWAMDDGMGLWGSGGLGGVGGDECVGGEEGRIKIKMKIDVDAKKEFISKNKDNTTDPKIIGDSNKLIARDSLCISRMNLELDEIPV